MPDEKLWGAFFAPAGSLERLGLTAHMNNAVDFGYGYETFWIPAARVVRGTVYALDIDPAMVAATRAKAQAEGLQNVRTAASPIADG